MAKKKETCRYCGKEYEPTGYEGALAPHWCEACEDELNAACGGSWIGAVYQASRNNDPLEDADL